MKNDTFYSILNPLRERSDRATANTAQLRKIEQFAKGQMTEKQRLGLFEELQQNPYLISILAHTIRRHRGRRHQEIGPRESPRAAITFPEVPIPHSREADALQAGGPTDQAVFSR